MGLKGIAEHDQSLFDRPLGGLDPGTYAIVSPAAQSERAAIVSFDPVNGSADRTVADLARLGLEVAVRGGHVRVSPHLHNTTGDIDAVLEALAAVGTQ